MIITTVIRNCNRRLLNNRNRSQSSFNVFGSHSSTSIEKKRWFMTGGSKLKENTDGKSKIDKVNSCNSVILFPSLNNST